MQLNGISYGNEIGGRAFLASTGNSIVELCFENHDSVKGGRETLFVSVSQYMEFEEIRVSDNALFGMLVDSDNDFDKDLADEAIFELYGDEFDDTYHEDRKIEIKDSVYANEIRMARYAMDLFLNEKYGALGELFGKEADEFDAPEVEYDRVG